MDSTFDDAAHISCVLAHSTPRTLAKPQAILDVLEYTPTYPALLEAASAALRPGGNLFLVGGEEIRNDILTVFRKKWSDFG